MTVQEQERVSSTSCGLFNWRPKWAQKFANHKTYMFLFTILGMIQSMAFSYLTVVLSTIGMDMDSNHML